MRGIKGLECISRVGHAGEQVFRSLLSATCVTREGFDSGLGKCLFTPSFLNGDGYFVLGRYSSSQPTFSSSAPGGLKPAKTNRTAVGTKASNGMPLNRSPRFTYDGKSLRDAMKHCVDLVKERDNEFFQWCSQLPLKEHRAPIFVLKALAIEIESIQWQARTETLLKMRYQWWRDSVSKAFAAKQSYEMSQPVMKALSELIQCHEISKHRVDAIIDAYERDALRSHHMSTMEELEDHAHGTVSQLLSLQLESCGLTNNPSEHTAISHLGKAIGLAYSLQNAEISLKNGKSYFPVDVCQRHNATPTEFLINGGQSVLPAIAQDIAVAAQEHLSIAKSSFGDNLGHFRIQGLSTELYLGALRKAGFDIFSSKMHRNGYLPIEYLVKMKWRFMTTS